MKKTFRTIGLQIGCISILPFTHPSHGRLSIHCQTCHQEHRPISYGNPHKSGSSPLLTGAESKRNTNCGGLPATATGSGVGYRESPLRTRRGNHRIHPSPGEYRRLCSPQ